MAALIDYTSWTYGEQPDLEEWCQAELDPYEGDAYYALPDYYSVLREHLCSTAPASTETAAAFVSPTDDPRPLSEIFKTNNARGNEIQQVIEELPAQHSRLANLLLAVRRLPDDCLEVTPEQRKELDKWGDHVRLKNIMTHFSDIYWWTQQPYEPHDSADNGDMLAWYAFQACYCVHEESLIDLDHIGLHAIMWGLEDANETALSSDTRVPIAIYWLIRAGRLIYKNFDSEDSATSWAVNSICNSRAPHLWNPIKDSDRSRLCPARWQFWKERLQWFSEQSKFARKTTEMAAAAMETMNTIETDSQIGFHKE